MPVLPGQSFTIRRRITLSILQSKFDPQDDRCALPYPSEEK
jgi:hypothetical protein